MQRLLFSGLLMMVAAWPGLSLAMDCRSGAVYYERAKAAGDRQSIASNRPGQAATIINRPEKRRRCMRDLLKNVSVVGIPVTVIGGLACGFAGSAHPGVCGW